VRAIDYTAYRVMAEERLRTIERELAARHGARVRIAHRLGELEVGEPSVAIAISAPHRAAAYDANREALERIKREVPIWKRELYADGGSSWREVEPLQQDH
jgi:molybdopterin synthase catalytic subunit